MINVLASDSKQDPDVMAANATSAALMLSDIPWAGPIGVIRLGRVDGQFVINPTVDEVRIFIPPLDSINEWCSFACLIYFKTLNSSTSH